ncbi:DnaJ family domain-containing protein [Palleronia sp.]|uniref:DnaJ family domain-containing protein n=1 Tax=Palleronia sp. TaxID=1940284 RepID=UPI0035C7DBF8
MLFFERLARERIERAMEEGAFDDLPYAGERLPFEPGEPVVPKSLRESGYTPPVVILNRKLEALRAQLAGERDRTKRRTILAEIAETDMRRRMEIERAVQDAKRG